MSGQELAEKLRNQYPELRVLLMSGYSEYSHGKQQASGCYAMLQKPFTLQALAEKVREILKTPSIVQANTGEKPLV
jgi:two-component system cell cycle sensor histidine kinase/response regulator CckA